MAPGLCVSQQQADLLWRDGARQAPCGLGSGPTLPCLLGTCVSEPQGDCIFFLSCIFLTSKTGIKRELTSQDHCEN